MIRLCIVVLVMVFPVSKAMQASGIDSEGKIKPQYNSISEQSLMRKETLGTNPCTLVRMRNKDTQQETHLRPRVHPARIVDFFHFGFEHELPILRMRLAQMAPYVDEIHIAEGDRDHLGFAKSIIFPQLLANDPELAQWRGKMVHHPVHVPESLPSGEGHYAIQAAINQAKYNISGAGVLLEGELDEIVSRTVLKSFKYCEPVTAQGWKGGIQMDAFMYNMGWTNGPWPIPCFLRDIGSLAKEKAERLAKEKAGNLAEQKANSILEEDMKYIFKLSDFVTLANGNPAGWHVAWALDGPEGIANKILHGHVEGIPPWAKAHAASQEELATFIRTVFLHNPAKYDTSVKASNLQVKDLPECVVEDPYKYKGLLGSAFPVALRAQSQEHHG